MLAYTCRPGARCLGVQDHQQVTCDLFRAPHAHREQDSAVLGVCLGGDRTSVLAYHGRDP
eukprot:4023734-Prymnesium_polylepis.1